MVTIDVTLNFAHVVELGVFVVDDGLFVVFPLVGCRSADVMDELTRRLVVHLPQMVLADGHDGHTTDATNHHEDAYKCLKNTEMSYPYVINLMMKLIAFEYHMISFLNT